MDPRWTPGRQDGSMTAIIAYVRVSTDEQVESRARLEAHASKRADTLVVAKLDRLSRSVLDFAELMNRATKQHWALVALDIGVDMTTPQGEMMANILATFARFERRLIGQRTRDALSAKKAQGVRLGRPRRVPQAVVARIVKHRRQGEPLAAIADLLTAEGVPTAQGGKRWYASTVRAIIRLHEQTEGRPLRPPRARR